MEVVAMRFLRVVLPVVILLAATPVFGQGTPIQRDAQALALLARSQAAMGGAVALQVQDSVVTATAWVPGRDSETGTVTIKTRGPDQLRLDGNKDGQSFTSIVSRGQPLRRTERGWASGPSSNSRNRRVDHLPFFCLAHELGRADLSATYVGLEKVNDRSAHHVRVARVSSLGSEVDERLTKNSELDIFIDEQTLLVIKVSYIHLSETDWRRGVPMEIYYSDYQNVSGVLIPTIQRKVFNGYAISEMRITSVTFNVGLTDSDFEGR
jgi:hypothetical protein